jgi:hypothetical protein
VISLNVSLDALTYFVEILDGVESHFSPQTLDNLMLLVREFGHKSLIASLAPQLDVPRRGENIHGLLQEFDMANGSTTIKTDFQSNHDSLAVIQCHISEVAEGFDGKHERILSESEKMTQLVK